MGTQAIPTQLDEARALLCRAVGPGGHALVDVHPGHDHRPYVYLRALTRHDGTPLSGLPQQVLGMDVWLDVVELLTALVRAGGLPGDDGSGRHYDIAC